MGAKEKFMGSSAWLGVSHGKMYATVGGEKKEIGGYSGYLIDLFVKEEVYKGQAYDKLVLVLLDDDDEKTIKRIGFDMRSGYCFSFFSMVPNIDPKKPIEISASEKRMDNGNTYGQLFIKQDGKNLKWFYTKDNENGKKVPKPKESLLNGKPVKDYEKRNAFIQKVLLGFLDKKVRPAFPDGKRISEQSDVPENNDAESITDTIDDLPF